MVCVSPLALNDRELLVYIDGEADRQVVAHLEQCPHCRERAYRLARLQDCLTAVMYRLTCPSPLELGEYHLGLLSRDRATTVARHLADCPHCAREVVLLKDYLAKLTSELEFDLWQQIKVLVAQLVRVGQDIARSGSPTLVPAYRGGRGEEKGPRLYQAEDIQVSIEIQDDVERQDRKVLLGLVTEMDTHELKAHLWQAEQLVTTASVDDLGNFVIADLTPGNYELILSNSGVELHIQSLEI
jgi:hypothetical protein